MSKSSSSYTGGKSRLKGKGLCAVETDSFKLSQPQEGRHDVAAFFLATSQLHFTEPAQEHMAQVYL